MIAPRERVIPSGSEKPLLDHPSEGFQGDMLDQLAEDLIAGVRIVPVCAGRISGPEAADWERRCVAGNSGDMVEQVLNLDRIALRKRNRWEQVAETICEPQLPLAEANWWSSAAVVSLLIEPIWKSVSGVIGVRASALAKPKFMTVLNPAGIVTPRVRPGSRKWSRWAWP